jgi:hypothetical protein
MDKCIICFENKNLIKICKCNYYIHQKCFDEWCELNNNNCLMCKNIIHISYKKKFIIFLSDILNFWIFISKYNLYTLTCWDDND